MSGSGPGQQERDGYPASHRLVRNPDAPPGSPPDEQYSYTGEPITLDPANVLALPANPTTAAYPAGSSALRACVNFNYTYTNLLKRLHATLNGEPGGFPATIGLMMSCAPEVGLAAKHAR